MYGHLFIRGTFMKTKISYLLVACLLSPLALQAAQGDPIRVETTLIDVPTSEVLDRYQASFLSRAYANGDFMETIDFGIHPRVNLGLSLAAHELVGASHSVRVLNPTFLLKWKVYDGNLYLPAIAIGYDGRRYGYGYAANRKYTNAKRYLDNRKGGFVSFSREGFFPGFTASAGFNLSDVDWDDTYLFMGVFYRVINQLGLAAEWDSIHNVRDSRVNVAARFYLHPSLALDAGVRRIGRGDESERIIQVRYVANF